MIKPTGLLTACGVLVVLGGLVFWFQKNPSKPEPATPPAPKVIALGEDQIEGIRLAKAGADPIVLRKTDRWKIVEPKTLNADDDAMKALISSAASLQSDRLIDEKPADLNAFGLLTPVEEVDITVKGGIVTKLLIGSDTPSGSATYVKLEGNLKVFTVFSSAKANFDKSLTDLRDKRLLTFNSDKVTAVSITSKGPAFEFAKNGQNEWQITKPKAYRADSAQVDDLLRKLKDAKMDLTSEAPDFAKATKVGSASVTDAAGTQTIEIRQTADKVFVAKSSAVDGTYKLAGDLAEGLKEKDVASFRNKRLFDFNFSEPTRVEINGAAYQKTAEKWTGPSGQIDAGSLQSVIDKLRDLAAASFADKFTGTQTLQFAVTSGDNHKVEKVTINKAGDEVQAQRGDDPSVYILKTSAFDELEGAIKAIKPYSPPKTDGKQDKKK